MNGVLLLATTILIFISQQTTGQINPFNKKSPFQIKPDSTLIKKHPNLLNMDSIVSKDGINFVKNRLRGFYNNMPIMKPDSNIKNSMPFYNPDSTKKFNMPCVPFVYENEKHIGLDKVKKNKKP